MRTPGWIEKLQERWRLKSVWQVVVVLFVFACTGFTIVLIKGPVLSFFLGDQTPGLSFSIIYYVLILPVYNIVLLAYGFVFGQFSFFWEFEKRFIRRIISIFRKFLI